MLNVSKLVEANPWWKVGHAKEELTPKFKREIFQEIIESISLRQITAILGLRRTGKTTLLYQVIQHLLNQGIKPEHILYFSFDETVENLDDILNLYKEHILRKGLGEGNLYFFFDEIQKLSDWQNKIKIIYDTHPNIKIFISGSASLNILIYAKENLAGRIFYFTLHLLSFQEFLTLKGKKMQKIKENVLLWKDELRVELNNYLLRPFPETVNADDELAKKYIKEGVIEKVIFKDLTQLFGIHDIELIDKIVHILANNPGMIVSLEDLSKDFGRSRQLISNYLYYLCSCFVVNGLKNYRGSLKVSSRKLKKYYLSHPAFALALDSPDVGKVVENLVMFALKTDHYWRDLNKEVDFIVINKKTIPVEVKYKNNIRKKDIKGLLKFMDEYKLKEGIVITDDMLNEETIEGKKIKYEPLWRWLAT